MPNATGLLHRWGLQVTPPAATGASAHMEVIVNSSAHAIRAMFDGMSDAEVVALMTSKSLAGICQPQAAPAFQTSPQGILMMGTSLGGFFQPQAPPAPQTRDQGAAVVSNKKSRSQKSASTAVSGQPQAAPAAGSGQPQAAPAADYTLPQAPGSPTKRGRQ